MEDWAEEDTIDLYLNPLRKAINNAVKRHLVSVTVEPQLGA